MKDRTVVLSLFTLFFLILPGIAGLYLFQPSLLSSLDWVKLVLLSATFTAPFAVINATAVGLSERRKRERNDDLFYDFVFGTMITGITIYAVLIIAYLGKFTANGLLVLLATAEVGIALTIWMHARKENKRK